jgi:hypothetical protein
MQDAKARQLEIIHNAVGPVPWYWKNFPSVTSASGQAFEWTFHGNDGELAYLVTLGLPHQPDTLRLALNTYCRPFLIPSGKLGVWCPEPNEIRVLCFDPDQLAAFSFTEIAGWFKRSNDRLYSTTAPMVELELASRLQPGMQKIEVPEPFRHLDELLLVSSYPAKTKNDPAAAIFVLYPHAGLVEVLPQKWFTANQFEVGPQWISRVARDPVTHRIVGEAVRIGTFELTDDGCEIAAWIEPQ